jgi:WD40 repeat protein
MGPLLLWDIDQQTAIRQFLTHDHIVTALCVSKNGRYALSGSADKTVKLWDLEGRVESMNQRRSMSDVGIERGISIVETKEGVPSQRVFTGNKEWVDSVAISTELRLAVSGGEDNSVRVWDLDSGESRGTFWGHEGRVGAVIVIPSLGLIVSGGGDSTVRLWDSSSGENRGVLRGHTSSITALGCSEATGWLFSTGADGTVRVWDIEAHRCVRTFDNNQIDIEDLVVLDDGRRCLFADRAGVLRIWEPTVGPTAAFMLARPRAQVALSEEQLRMRSFMQTAEEAKRRGMLVQAITLIDEARQIKGYEHSPSLLNLRHSYGLPLARRRVCEIFDRYVWREHHGAVRAIAGLAGLAASGGEDGSLILWNLETGKADLHLAAHSRCIRALASNADGTYLVSGGDDGVVRRLNMADRTVLEGRGHYKIVFDAEFSSDGRLAVSGGEDGTLRIWDASTWQCRQTLRVAGQKAPSITDIMSRSILSVAIAPDARSVFTGGEGKLRVWDLERGAPVNTYEQVDMQYIRRLFVMPDGEHLIIGGDRIEGPGSKWVRITACRLIQVSDGRCLEQREGIYPLAVSRDGGLFAAVEGGEIGVYSTQNLSLLTKVASSGAEITAAAFSGDTRFLLIGREDGTIQAMEIIWEYESSPVSYNANCRA